MAKRAILHHPPRDRERSPSDTKSLKIMSNSGELSCKLPSTSVNMHVHASCLYETLKNTCCVSFGEQDENRPQDPSARPDQLMVGLLVSSGSLKNHSVYNRCSVLRHNFEFKSMKQLVGIRRESTSRSSESTSQIRLFTTVCAL